MTLVSPSQSNPNDEITAEAINGPINQIASVVNGNIDSTNVASLSGAKLNAGTVPASALDTNANPETRFYEVTGNLVGSGGVWTAQVSTLNAGMTALSAYITGKRIQVAVISSRTFTASKDTYVAVDASGIISYIEVANNAATPSLPANSLWLARVISNGSQITSIVKADGRDAVYLQKSASQAVANSTSTIVTWNSTPAFDRNLQFDPSTNRIYSRKAGVYAIYSQVRYTATSGSTTTLNIYKNGTQLNDRNTPNAPGFAAFSTDTLIFLEEGDYLDVRVFQDSGSSKTIDGYALGCYMYCVRIS